MTTALVQGPHLLFAAGWLDLLPFIIAGAIYIIKMISDAAKEQKQRQARQRQEQQMPRIERAAQQQPPPMPRQAQPMQAGQGQRPKTPAEEVEEFLRRAAARKAGGRQPQQAPKLPTVEKPAPRRLSQEPAQRREQAVEAEVVEASEGPSLTGPRPTGAGVASHVEQHLDEREFTQRAQHLSHLKQTGGGLAEHVQQTFEHRVGTITRGSPAQIASTAMEPAAEVMERVSAGGQALGQNFAAELAALLRRPEDVRTAVILSELMRRPEERW